MQSALVYQWTKLVNTSSALIYFAVNDPADLMLNVICECDMNADLMPPVIPDVLKSLL